MSKAILVSVAGTQVGEVELSKAVSGIEPNQTVVHEVVKNHLASCRQGTQSALVRAEASGGGIKLQRQKGTGRTRQGNIHTPQRAHGGITFALKPRDCSYVLNKKARYLIPESVLSTKTASSDIIIVDSLNLNRVRTKAMGGPLNTVGAKKAVIVTPGVGETTIESAQNIPGAVTTAVKVLSVYNIVNAGKSVVDKTALIVIKEVFA